MSSATDQAWSLEEELLRPEVRRDAARLDDLLAPGFREIGQSGRQWSRAEIIEALTTEKSDLGPVEISDRYAEELPGGVVLLTFRLQAGGRTSLRTSLWEVTGYGSRLLFHQGTPVSGA